ncbi:hypothetical protein [Gulosibacter chungangensis]|uniref:DUF3311 domain-containing protein n=1 Tax=Gulosibacter chungangensis TaxID=979746 RepID=A0A7J5BFE2_9MICO|nr:hypothetical protein [Gulosibacter chungangensis]KAB1644955.1 hypothetical protein F8O05_01440 [Gulosibacter chungangensis]
MKVQRRIFQTVSGIYFTLCTLAFIWPLATIANTIEPKILGVPFFFAWNLIVVVIIFIGCVGMYIWDTRLTDGRRSQIVSSTREADNA